MGGPSVGHPRRSEVVSGLTSPNLFGLAQVGAPRSLGELGIVRHGLGREGSQVRARIGAAADEANHHPNLTITYPRVHVLLTTHDAHGLTTRDVGLARTISAIAVELAITAERTIVNQLES